MNNCLSCLVSAASDGEFGVEVVFALDYSSSVTPDEFQKELNFVKQLAESWNSPLDDSILVIYGDCAKAVPFDPDYENLFFFPDK